VNNSKAVKIPSLLAQYLYCHQRLDLPGIGTFLLDNSAVAALETSKQRSMVLEGVSFQYNATLHESPALVAFIAEKTGKMKPLAAADLDSHLQSAHLFLNIGKPFTFEGIGILTKIKPGEFEFTPISVSTEKVREFSVKESDPATAKENTGEKYESFLAPGQSKVEWKRPVAALLILCGIGATVWGGYEISKKVKKGKPSVATENPVQPQTLPADTNTVVADTVKQAPPAEPADPRVKYVLEVAKSKRAFKRFNQLKEINWNVELETSDSVQYKLFMMLPPSDTAKTLDSLMVMTGRKVYIEYPEQSSLRSNL
jgi:hypothetical protein